MKYRLGDITVKHWNDWDRVPRDPFSTYAFITGLGYSGAAAIALTAVAYVAVTAVTSWAIRALSPKPSFGSAADRGLLVNAREATAPQQIVYGEIRKGGTVTFIESTGDTNQYLHQIIVLAGHEVNSIGDIYINDEVVTLDGSGFVTDAKWQDGDSNSKIRINTHTGADNQTADSDLVSETSVTSDFKGEGIAYIYVRMEYDQDVFAEGVPLFTAKVQGKKVYDPRTSTTGYSANAALCIRDYLVSAYGLDNSGDTNDTSFQAAANTCDESVDFAGSGSGNRYEINGVINLDQSPSDILADMMTACAGTLFWGQGEWHLKVGEYTSPIKTFTLDDLRGPINVDTKHSRRDNFNIVRGTFVDADQDFIRADYPEIRSATFISDDNDVESAIDLALPLTTSSAMAQRLAKMTLFRAREQMTFTADFSLEAFEVECGDIIALTIDRYGWTAKEFEVVGWKFKNDGDAGDLRVALTLRETSSAAFSWSAEESEITGNDSTLPSPSASLTISSLSTGGGGRTTTDGTFINSVIVSWTAPANSFITHYEVEWRPTADSNYAATTTTETSIELSPLIDGVEYTIRVRAVTSNGRRGPFVTATFTGGGDTTAPSAPTAVTATGGYKLITLNWTNPTDADLNYVEIYESTENSTDAPELITDGDLSEAVFGGYNFVNWSNSNNAFVVSYGGYLSGGTPQNPSDDQIASALGVVGSLSQTISTVSGETYVIEFNQVQYYAPVDAEITITGNSQLLNEDITDFDSGGLGTIVEHEFTADSASTTISFDATSTSSDFAISGVTVKNKNGLSPIAVASSDTFTRTNLGLNQTRYYFLKAVDYSGNKSAFTTSVNATTSFLDDNDFENGVRQLFIDQGLDIIEPVSSLPTSGDFTGQTVYLTSDGKLYNWTGSQWSAIVADVGTVDFSDLTGTLAANQIAVNSISGTKITDNTITSTEIASNTINAGNIAANAIGTSELSAFSVTADKVASNAITAAKIQAGTITGNKISANTITGGLLATSGIITSAAQISNAVITNAKIQNAAVDTLKVAGESITTSAVAQFNAQSGTSLSFSTSIYMDYAGDIYAICYLDPFGTSSSSSYVETRFYIDGTLMGGTNASGSAISISAKTFVGSKAVSTGTKTLQATISLSNVTNPSGDCAIAILRRYR